MQIKLQKYLSCKIIMHGYCIKNGLLFIIYNIVK